MSDNLDFSLLDGTVDDLADLKAFKPLPIGSYKMQINWELKEINSKPAVSVKLTVQDVLELKNATEVVNPGDSTTLAFILQKENGERNEMAEGLLKQIVSVLHPVFGGSSIRETIAASEGASILCTLSHRYADKNDKDKVYNVIKSIDIAP